MDNQDVAKLKAKYRLELLVALLVLVLASGGVAEYRRFNASLSSAVIIVDAGSGVAKADIHEPSSNTNQPIKAPASSLNPPKAQEVALPMEQPINTTSQNSVELTQKLLLQNDAASSEISEITAQTEQKLQKSVAETNDALQSFLGYIQTSQQKLDEVKLPAFRLDDIQEKVITSSNEKKAEPQFKQGVIEIYDSEKGVVDVQSTNAALAQEKVNSQENNEVKEEKKQNVAPVEKTTPQTEQQAQSVEQSSQIEQKSQSNNQTSQSDIKLQQNEKSAPVINSSAQNENKAEPKVAEPKAQSVEPAVEEKKVSENIDNSASANAPVNMMEKIAPTDNQAQDVKNNSVKTEEVNENPAPADNVKKDDSQVATSLKSEEVSSVSSSAKDVKSVQEKVGAKTSDIKSQQVQKTSSSDIEDKALKTKRANEALENLFKKIALPEKQIIVVDPNSVKPTSLNKSESGENISNPNQLIENNKENNNPATNEVNNNGAVDMMKAIVSRK